MFFFQSIWDNLHGYPVLAVHKPEMEVLHHIIEEQKCNIVEKHPNGYHIEHQEDGTWNKYFCNETLECEVVNDLYLAWFRIEEHFYTPYALDAKPCWCPARLNMTQYELFQQYIYEPMW